MSHQVGRCRLDTNATGLLLRLVAQTWKNEGMLEKATVEPRSHKLKGVVTESLTRVNTVPHNVFPPASYDVAAAREDSPRGSAC
jgi:hypothetical protein